MTRHVRRRPTLPSPTPAYSKWPLQTAINNTTALENNLCYSTLTRQGNCPFPMHAYPRTESPDIRLTKTDSHPETKTVFIHKTNQSVFRKACRYSRPKQPRSSIGFPAVANFHNMSVIQLDAGVSMTIHIRNYYSFLNYTVADCNDNNLNVYKCIRCCHSSSDIYIHRQ